MLVREDEAIELLQKAVALDPLSTTTLRALGIRGGCRHEEDGARVEW
jgi:hypothetical protein